MDMEPKKHPNKCYGIRILIIVVMLVLSIIAVVFLGLYARKIHEDNIRITWTSENLKMRFPGYFRTPAEQQRFETSIKYTLVNETVFPDNDTCFLPNSTCIPNKRGNGTINTSSCCQWKQSFWSPIIKENIKGFIRTFAKIGDFRQHFQISKCSKIEGCNGCDCYQKQTITSAVVYKLSVTDLSEVTVDDTEIDLFYFGTCCNCINI